MSDETDPMITPLPEAAQNAIRLFEFTQGNNFTGIMTSVAAAGASAHDLANIALIAGSSFAANCLAHAAMQVDASQMSRPEALELMREAMIAEMDRRAREILPDLEVAAAFGDATHPGTGSVQ